ncbi:hypothetical protein IWX49DRAFT_628090, partial [Phyllosticta citricarpa]
CLLSGPLVLPAVLTLAPLTSTSSPSPSTVLAGRALPSTRRAPPPLLPPPPPTPPPPYLLRHARGLQTGLAWLLPRPHHLRTRPVRRPRQPPSTPTGSPCSLPTSRSGTRSGRAPPSRPGTSSWPIPWCRRSPSPSVPLPPPPSCLRRRLVLLRPLLPSPASHPRHPRTTTSSKSRRRRHRPARRPSKPPSKRVARPPWRAPPKPRQWAPWPARGRHWSASTSQPRRPRAPAPSRSGPAADHAHPPSASWPGPRAAGSIQRRRPQCRRRRWRLRQRCVGTWRRSSSSTGRRLRRALRPGARPRRSSIADRLTSCWRRHRIIGTGAASRCWETRSLLLALEPGTRGAAVMPIPCGPRMRPRSGARAGSGTSRGMADAVSSFLLG